MTTQTILQPAVASHLHGLDQLSFQHGRITLPPNPFNQKTMKLHGTVAPPPTPQPTANPKQLVRDPGLLVVSNRMPVSVKRTAEGSYRLDKPSGGLVTGLSGIDKGASFSWYGWPGLPVPEEELQDLRSVLKEQHHAVAIPLDDDLADLHYNGFCNSTLWPLFHYEGCFSYNRGDWEAYQRVNQIFADRLAADCVDGDVVWVHDYHLMLVPEMLRKHGLLFNKKITIGFFLHTPFPAGDHFKILPTCKELLAGVLGSDMIGFHTASYAKNFKATCTSILGHKISHSKVFLGKRSVHVKVSPIGIDPDSFTRELAKPELRRLSDSLRDTYKDKRVLLGIDRLDYIKGLPRKIEALTQLLSQQPEWIGRLVLIQVVVPSRQDIGENQELFSTLNRLADEANRQYGKSVSATYHDLLTHIIFSGSDGYQPVTLLHSNVPFNELVTLYNAADICLVASTRDGMNLVASEYVASQQEHERKGVLVLSKFAGAAEQLAGSVQFNPWCLDDMVDALTKALTMSESERASRHEQNRKFVVQNTR
ncbi:Alpha,alpha-trehalose-phosphate synthase [UDP-forming] 2 [Cyphellophora attinorum]|uniref:Alpha,alpha-trehalose-phosphate synthase [UDP-forming] 2 n=1 Tax=Cyphellophora attinorum TaxID=1664694 RepID=A0A0N1P2M2_9EURO|nr:Alpha,alpha-trehalose-phosphate synthase [UDP-forming] 2 [Phialophora attinorum]KPI45536.1 Alpha,alpha-trehalose-phosphate synthase [UDP-forming] 2 [Phialophora attinorum]